MARCLRCNVVSPKLSFCRVYKSLPGLKSVSYTHLDVYKRQEKDWATWNFLQWFVQEQIEEETLAMDLIDKLKIAGGDRATDESLFNLDKTLGVMPDEAESARDATGTNP